MAKLRIDKAGAAVSRLLRSLASRGDTAKSLEGLFENRGAEGLLEFRFYWDYLNYHRILCRKVNRNSRPLMTIVPISSRYSFESGRVRIGQKYVLSRFAYIRRSGGNLILESPLSHAHIILHNRSAAEWIHQLAHPKGCTGKNILIFDLLWNAGALSEADSRNRIREEKDSKLSHWEFHDLLFHSRSRVGRHGNPYGKIENRVLHSRVEKSGSGRGVAIDLYKPGMQKLKKTDLPFTRVLEMRRSQRKHGDKPITLQQLGEFLYRSACIRENREPGRPVFPGAGAIYELKLYVVICKCDGITPGMYHYDSVDHRLFRISDRTDKTDRLLRSAAATAHADLPQILILMGCRFERMNRQYRSISYASVLKDVGVVFQTLYLVATAMGLAGCALGVGDSDLFSEVANTDYYEETSVGEFILGTSFEDR